MRSNVSISPKRKDQSMDASHRKDEEILETILEEFEEDGRLNMNYIDIEVFEGVITINGRVTSEEELTVIDELLVDTLNISDFNNKVWVDDSLTYEDPDDSSPNIKGITIDDDDIDDQKYDEDEDEDEDY